MGGTCLRSALKKAYKMKEETQMQAKVFVFTDGEDWEPKKVAKIVSENSSVQISTLGFGSHNFLML